MKGYGALIIASLLIFSSCRQGEKAEAVEAAETANQMEYGLISDPVIAARNEARKLLVGKWRDSTELERPLLEAASVRAAYIENGEKEKAAKFDSAYYSTVKAVRPDLARYIRE